ncbi:MAG: LamG domain-containing protein [Acidobacteriota bacterium]
MKSSTLVPALFIFTLLFCSPPLAVASDETPPVLGVSAPRGTLPVGASSTGLRIDTDEAATCRWSTVPGVAYESMLYAFAAGALGAEGQTHEATLSGLEVGTVRVFVRCADLAGNVQTDDHEIAFYVAAPVAGFHPVDLPGVRFFVESRVGVAVAACDTSDCRAAGDNAPLDRQFCDLSTFPDGCARRWQDQSDYVPALGFEPPEWTRGRDFGQDDLDKPGFVLDCVNGLPCLRGGPGEVEDRTFEIEPGQQVDGVTGPFSIAVLARPRAQDDDSFLFGFAGSELSRRVTSDTHRARIAFGGTVTLAPAGEVPVDAWHLFELHRDAADAVRLLIDGVDVTEGAQVAPGEMRFRFLLSVARVRAFHGDVALALVVDGELDAAQRQELRNYVARTYGVGVEVPPPAAAWRFDEGSSDCVLVAEAGPDGARGPACPADMPLTVEGRDGEALLFDGDDEVVLGADPSLASPPAFTLAAWVRADPRATWRSILDFRDSRDDGYDLYLDPDGQLFLRANRLTFNAAPSFGRVDDGAWHHVAGTYDGESLGLFVDGVSIGRAGLGATSLDVSAPGVIGRNYRFGVSTFSGTIDEPRIWTEALDAAQIAVLAAR